MKRRDVPVGAFIPAPKANALNEGVHQCGVCENWGVIIDPTSFKCGVCTFEVCTNHCSMPHSTSCQTFQREEGLARDCDHPQSSCIACGLLTSPVGVGKEIFCPGCGVKYCLVCRVRFPNNDSKMHYCGLSYSDTCTLPECLHFGNNSCHIFFKNTEAKKKFVGFKALKNMTVYNLRLIFMAVKKMEVRPEGCKDQWNCYVLKRFMQKDVWSHILKFLLP
jgi:hypothetical protein